jgi:uncharacterized protein DUF6152
LLAAAPAVAHHSPAAFDMTRQVTIVGTVASFEWANPHAYLSLRDDADGRTWLIELVSPSALKQYGWTAATLAKGDRVSVIASPSRTPERSTAFLQSIEKAGSVLYANALPGTGATPPNAGSPDGPRQNAGAILSREARRLLARRASPARGRHCRAPGLGSYSAPRPSS